MYCYHQRTSRLNNFNSPSLSRIVISEDLRSYCLICLSGFLERLYVRYCLTRAMWHLQRLRRFPGFLVENNAPRTCRSRFILLIPLRFSIK